jgi:hypothetical protein
MNNPVHSGRLGGTLFALPNDARVFRCSVTARAKNMENLGAVPGRSLICYDAGGQ